MRSMLALALLAVPLLGAFGAPIPLSTDITKPVTVPWDPSLRPRTLFLPLDSGLTADNTTGNEPSQIHLSVAGPGAMSVMWATGKAKTGQGPLTPNDALSAGTIVRWGSSPGALTSNATGSASVYSQIYNTSYASWGGCGSALNYTSPVLHTAVMGNLKANITYYQVGDGETFSPTLSFQSLKAAGQEYPQRLLLIADWGLSYNSSSTLDHIMQSAANSTSPPLILYIADYTYADTWYPNGTVSIPNTAVEGNPNAGSWQPVWDAWQRFVQPLVSRVPFVGGTGNHEEEQEADGSIFKSVQARWPTPHQAAGSPSFFFYSVNAGPSHNIFLSNYVDYTLGSDQQKWLEADLAAVDRNITPWVTVSFHNPWYTTDTSYKEFEQMRIDLEPITYRYGVDIFFYGHVHAYERSTPVFNYTVDMCGPVHITIGDGGNSEGVSFLYETSNLTYEPVHQFEDFNGGCPQVNASHSRPSYLYPINPSHDPWAWYQRVLTFQADGNSTGVGNPPGYCYKEQPPWSAYRESSFGHGTLDIVNATHALWRWHANQDSNAVARDQVYVVRDTGSCPNKMGLPKEAPAPAVNPVAAG